MYFFNLSDIFVKKLNIKASQCWLTHSFLGTSEVRNMKELKFPASKSRQYSSSELFFHFQSPLAHLILKYFIPSLANI